MNPLTYLVINLAIIALLMRGSHEVNNGALTQGEIIALINYMNQILVSLLRLADLVISVTRALASGMRVNEILNTHTTMPDLSLIHIYVDPKISITFIENGHVAKKSRPEQPKRLVNVIKCKNPRCITSIEEGCDHIFALTPSGKYRCVYCEQEFSVKP